MYRWSTEVLFSLQTPKTMRWCQVHTGCTSTGSNPLPWKASTPRWSLARQSFHTEGVFGGWTCCISCGRFTRGFRLFGLLFALLICTTKKARTTMAPRKAKTGMVWPTSWLYRPGIIPRKAKRVGRQQLPREPRWLCAANAIDQRDLPLTLVQSPGSH